jgi:hypothetical protein
VAHVAFNGEQRQRREAVAAEEEADTDDDLDGWSDDGSNPEEKAAEQGAILASFES